MTGQREATLRYQGRFELTDEEFDTLSSLIEKQIGIHYPREKKREFQMKLAKMSSSDFEGKPQDLIDAARVSDEVIGVLANLLTVGESYFFRNRPHFAALRNTILPDLISDAEDRHTLNIWSAGCATGEEPYSLAILLNDQFPYLKNWNVSIVATDINTTFLANARSGVFGSWSMRGVNEDTLKRHFHKDSKGFYHLHENIKRAVTFKKFNLRDLLHGARPMADNIDLIMCRNVLIYFPFKIGDGIINIFQEMVRHGGYLLVGHSESFPGLGNFEAIHAHATYYYRRYRNERTALLSMPAPETTAIPGIAVRTTWLPAAFHDSDSVEVERIETSEPEVTLEHQLDVVRQMANNGQSEDALRLLDDMCEKDGRLDYRAHFLHALIADHSGYVMKAVNSLKRAIFLNKGFVVGHYYLGVVSQREGDEAMAKRHFKNVIRLLGALSADYELEEAEGLTAGRLKEIVESLFEEMNT